MNRPSMSWRNLVLAGLLTALWPTLVTATDDVAGKLVQLNDNGAWCWYEGERAIIHHDKLLLSSVADSSGPGGSARNGNIELVTCDFVTGRVDRFVLHANLQDDDHDSAAILARPDGRYLAMYARHGSDNFSRWRITTHPGDTSAWEPEQTFNHGAGATYSNVYRLSAENGGAGRCYDLARTLDRDPNILVSDDEGATWSYAGRLLYWPVPSSSDPKFTGSDGGRPYLRYASNGTDEIHFLASDDHPRAYDNSIYHGVLRGGKIYDSFGNIVDANAFDGSALAPNAYTPVFDTDTSPLGFAWTTDLRLDSQGHPYALFTARGSNDDSTDHRFLYARFDGAAWHVHEIAKAGGYLYASENDYTGLGALDPRDPDTLYISSKIDPRDQSVGAHYELYRGHTTDGGASWTWTPITSNSTMDNIRPIVPPSDGERQALLWLRGTYNTYTSFDLRVVALFSPPVSLCADVPAVAVQTPLARGSNVVTVTGVDAAATLVTVYSVTVSGSTPIGTAPGNGTDTVPVVVPPLVAEQTVAATQTVAGVEGCIPSSGIIVPGPKIVYVDAQPDIDGIAGNTTVNGALVDFTSATPNATTGSGAGTTSPVDNLWRARTGYEGVNGNEIWEAGINDETPADLITTLSLPPGTYQLYGLFHNNSNGAGVWDAAFRVGATGGFTFFDKSNARLAAADGSDFYGNVSTRAGGQWLFMAPLGQFEIDGTVQIHIRCQTGAAGDDRTWYDGVGYTLICPLPFADVDGDHDVDLSDFGFFQTCMTGLGEPIAPGCACFNRPESTGQPDVDIDAADLDAFLDCFTGPDVQWPVGANAGCDS